MFICQHILAFGSVLYMFFVVVVFFLFLRIVQDTSQWSIAMVHQFLLLRIFYCGYTTIYSFILMLMNIWVVSSFWQF